MKFDVKRLVAVCALFGASFMSWGVDGTFIPAGQTFLLGGEQEKVLLVQGRNIGAIAVELSAQHNGQRDLVALIDPGQSFNHQFQKGETAMFKNTSATKQAVLKLEMTQDVSRLSMRYDAPATAKSH
jgi:hypothetical protein